MPTYLGIDGGGTHTRALLISAEGEVLGHGISGPSNPNNVGFALAMANWGAAATAAGSNSPDACVVGSAGVKSVSDMQTLTQATEAAHLGPNGRCAVVNDTEAALAGGLPGRAGIVLIAGTGSFCLGRDTKGVVAHCGGWGWLVDDIGSGFFLGREALRAAVFAADKREPATVLLAFILDHYQVSHPDDLLAKIYDNEFSPARVAALAPFVISAARTDDLVALAIIKRGCAGLSAQLLWLQAPEVLCSGGLARSGYPYQDSLDAALRLAIPGVRLSEPTLPPVAGAAIRALELAGLPITPELVSRLTSEWARLNLPS
jgi:N-acetylglucosamine kinase-like BadF-type ATPase